MIRRSKLQIIKDGLLGVSEMNTKLSFMYLGNMSNTQLQKYFNLALENDLLEKNGRHYTVTEKGWIFIHSVETAEKLISANKRESGGEL